MDAVSRTLYIPLYGKALVSRQGIVLHDPWAEEIWAREGFALRGKARSRWLAYYMGMRAAAIDRLVAGALEKDPGAVVLHLGCGLDARADRVGPPPGGWYDLDLPPVMAVRRRHFTEGPRYRMLAGDAGHPGHRSAELSLWPDRRQPAMEAGLCL